MLANYFIMHMKLVVSIIHFAARMQIYVGHNVILCNNRREYISWGLVSTRKAKCKTYLKCGEVNRKQWRKNGTRISTNSITTL